MANILHLSDLHFGQVLKGRDKELLTSQKGALRLAEFIVKQVKIKSEEEIGKTLCIVVTGDITNKAISGEFDLAEIFFNKLCTYFELTTKNLLLVPGNHDVDWEAEKLESSGKLLPKFSAYSKFFNKMFDTNWNANEPPSVSFTLPQSYKTAVVFGLNSCVVENKIWSGLGFIDEKQLTYIDNWLKKERKDEDPLIKLIALHHHVLPVFNYYPSFKQFNPEMGVTDNNPPPTSLILNASQLLKKCRKWGINAILHGHAHAPYSVTQQNYLDNDSRGGEHVARSIAILGCGSITAQLDGEYGYSRNHYQVIKIINRYKPAVFQIWPYKKPDDDPCVEDMQTSGPFHVPSDIKIMGYNHAISTLKNTLYQILLRSKFSKPELDDTINLYDSLLEEIMSWIRRHTGKDLGNVVVTKYIDGLNAYKNIAIFRYTEDVRHITYTLNEVSITTTCAITNQPYLVPSRSECEFASRSRDHIYQKKLGGDDQCCMYIPMNSTKADLPFAVIGFARPRRDKKSAYTPDDQSIVEDILDVVEDAFRQADLVEIAEKTNHRLQLFSWLANFVTLSKDDIFQALSTVCVKTFQHFGLHLQHGDAIAILLPKPPYFKEAYCVAELGFGVNSANNMTYELGKKEGLIGRIIDTKQFDYCFDHLAEGSISFQGQQSSKKCRAKSGIMINHQLSFVGVPIEYEDKKSSTGALILNISTPIGSGESRYIEEFYIEPLMTCANLLKPLISTGWNQYCLAKIENDQREKPKKIKASTNKTGTRRNVIPLVSEQKVGMDNEPTRTKRKEK